MELRRLNVCSMFRLWGWQPLIDNESEWQQWWMGGGAMDHGVADNAIGGCTTVTASLWLQSRDHSGNQRRRPLCCLCQLWWEILRLPGSLWASGVGRLSLFPLIVASRKKQCFPLAQRAWWKYWDTIGNGQWTWSYSSFLEVSQFVSKKSYLILQTYKATVCCFPIMFASTTQQTANAFFVAFPSSAML